MADTLHTLHTSHCTPQLSLSPSPAALLHNTVFTSVKRYVLLTHVEDFVTDRLGHNGAVVLRNMLALL